jgi:selenocysteine-specific elongation factor
MRVVATAGHVDHGKSSLVLALTGTDPDRFPEEKARGLTIDLGFGFAVLPSGTEVGFVDVPGHVRFIKNMLAGVGAVEVALLVVAANEGWMPQSEEHLRILELLGVAHGLTVITKADLVDDATLELAQLELDERLAGSPFEAAPVVTVDSRSGRGLDELRTALDSVLAAAPPPPDRGRPRLWIDRVFAARGAGTVVTGTLAGGRLATDDEVVVIPGGRSTRIRGIESHHQRLEVAEPGSRVALNLAGVEHHQLRRGNAVVRPDQWAEPTVIDVAVIRVAGEKLRRGVLQAYAGSGEHRVRLRPLDAEGRFARLRLDASVPLAPGDRLVLRDPGSRRTVAGAEVLDVAPVGRAKAAPARLALSLGPRLLTGRPWLGLDELGPLAGMSGDDAGELATALIAEGIAARAGDWLVNATVLHEVRREVNDRVVAHHRDRPLDRGVELSALAATLRIDAARLRAALEDAPDLTVDRGVVRHRSYQERASDSPEARQLVEALEAAPFAPPGPGELGTSVDLVRALVREGTLVDAEGVIFAARALDEARVIIETALRTRGSVTVADVRDLLGSTRKYVLPILNRLDAEGVTRRRGDDRIPGPRSGER